MLPSKRGFPVPSHIARTIRATPKSGPNNSATARRRGEMARRSLDDCRIHRKYQGNEASRSPDAAAQRKHLHQTRREAHQPWCLKFGTPAASVEPLDRRQVDCISPIFDRRLRQHSQLPAGAEPVRAGRAGCVARENRFVRVVVFIATQNSSPRRFGTVQDTDRALKTNSIPTRNRF